MKEAGEQGQSPHGHFGRRPRVYSERLLHVLKGPNPCHFSPGSMEDAEDALSTPQRPERPLNLARWWVTLGEGGCRPPRELELRVGLLSRDACRPQTQSGTCGTFQRKKAEPGRSFA